MIETLPQPVPPAPQDTPVVDEHPMIVGIAGYARSGKDTAAAALTSLGFAQASFAARIKDCLYALNPQLEQNGVVYRVAPLVDAYGWEKVKDLFPEARKLLQRLGTDAGRLLLGENVWVDAVLNDLPTGGTGVVIADCRFPNEANGIRARGGLVIRVERPGVGPATDDDGHVHESEVALDGFEFDGVVANAGTVDELHEQVASLVAHLWLYGITEGATQA